MDIRGTTILAVRKGDQIAMAGDGQVTLGNTVMKGNARKLRKIYNNQILVGFAGSTADAFTLEERFEEKCRQFAGDITRAAVEMAKEWRTDRALRKLEAMLIVADKNKTYVLSGNGDVIEPEKGSIGIGSGGQYAYAASLALLDFSDLSASDIAVKSLEIAGHICIYTNSSIILEELN